MAPPGMKGKKPGIMIAVGVDKPKGMKAPGLEDKAPMKPDAEDEGGKASVAEAHKVGADQHCKDCANYQAESGECSKVDGYWDPEDACVRYFEAAGNEEEPDADDQGGAPDADADDMGEADAK